MADEPIVLPQQVEPQVHEAAVSAERPAPSREEEQVADGLFSSEQEHALAALLNAQAGIVLAHHLVRETFQKDEEEEEEPRRRPEPDGSV
jgi:hypothetical protein